MPPSSHSQKKMKKNDKTLQILHIVSSIFSWLKLFWLVSHSHTQSTKGRIFDETHSVICSITYDRLTASLSLFVEFSSSSRSCSPLEVTRGFYLCCRTFIWITLIWFSISFAHIFSVTHKRTRRHPLFIGSVLRSLCEPKRFRCCLLGHLALIGGRDYRPPIVTRFLVSAGVKSERGRKFEHLFFFDFESLNHGILTMQRTTCASDRIKQTSDGSLLLYHASRPISIGGYMFQCSAFIRAKVTITGKQKHLIL